MDFIQAIGNFKSVNALVIGDVMVDSYLWGDVDRISPEAPVPVVSITKKEYRLGGAANVAMNIKALGGNPFLFSVIGNDDGAAVFKSLLSEHHIRPKGIIQTDGRMTTNKTRISSRNHQVVRYDVETCELLGDNERGQLVDAVKSTLKNESINVVIFQDYDKGILEETLIKEVTEACAGMEIPVAADPKKKNFFFYKNVNLFKPNIRELSQGLNIEIDPEDIQSLISACNILNERINATLNLVTLSEHGIFVSENDTGELVKAHKRSVSDVSGAGDTVISVAALCLASGIDMLTMAKLANVAGGLVCEKFGVVPVASRELEEEALRIHND